MRRKCEYCHGLQAASYQGSVLHVYNLNELQETRDLGRGWGGGEGGADGVWGGGGGGARWTNRDNRTGWQTDRYRTRTRKLHLTRTVV